MKAFIITATLAFIAACGSLEIAAGRSGIIITFYKNGTFSAVGPPGSCIQAVDEDGNLIGDPVQLDGEGKTTGVIPSGSHGVVRVKCPTNAVGDSIPYGPKGGKPKGSWHELEGVASAEGASASYTLRVRAHSFADATRKAVPFVLALTEDPTVAATIGNDIQVDDLTGYTCELSSLGLPMGDTSIFSLSSEPHSTFDVSHNGDRVSSNPEAALGNYWYASATVPAADLETAPGSVEEVRLQYEASQPLDEVGFKITF